MAHFAELNTENVVLHVIVVNNETLQDLPFPDSEDVGVAFCRSLFGADTQWRQTSYSASFRKNYAAIGYKYDAERDAFIPPQPYPSWVLNEASCVWDAPVPYPDSTKSYTWDEATLSWVEILLPPQPDYEVT